MLINDESCNSEKTILRQQKNGIIDLLGSQWYGIVLLSPGGRVYLDAHNDVEHIGNELPIRFVENCVRWDELLIQQTSTYEYEAHYFLIYTIRQTEQGRKVLFLHCKRDEPFRERDIRWYLLYCHVGQQRVLQENELIQEKNYLTSILESTEGAIAVVDPEYNIISSNDKAKLLFGKNLKYSSSGEMLSVMKAVDRVMAQEERLILPQVTYQKTESEFGFAIYKFVLTPLRNSKGRVGCVSVLATDITQKHIDRYRSTQKQCFEAVGNMTFEMTKDIRTPLMNIRGCASLLKEMEEGNGTAKELLAFIQSEADHIQQIGDQMDSFRNITRAGVYTSTDVNSVLRDCISAVYRERMQKKLTIEIRLEEDIPQVQIGNVDLNQILFNLFLSVIDSMEDEGCLKVVSRKLEDSIVVEISGKGCRNGNSMRDSIEGHDIDISFLLAKKIILDYGGKLEQLVSADDCMVRKVTLPYLV